jgi:hypothetical protein
MSEDFIFKFPISNLLRRFEYNVPNKIHQCANFQIWQVSVSLTVPLLESYCQNKISKMNSKIYIIYLKFPDFKISNKNVLYFKCNILCFNLN